MNSIRIKCPAKINLTLEVVNKRDDGFHNIKSIMQLINLYDYLDIFADKAEYNSITLSGNSEEIPYNEKNLVYKAADLFLKTTEITGYSIKINIEKNIPVAAGLAGGSTDAAGTLFGLNNIFRQPLDKFSLNELCAKLGSDLNVCLQGGCSLATSRGEVTESINSINSKVTLIKPKKLGISAKEAYTKYSQKTVKPKNYMTEKMKNALQNNTDIKPFLYNDLEYAVFDDYSELQYIKSKLPNSLMSGSGSTYFVLEDIKDVNFSEDYQVIRNLQFISEGVSVA